MPAKKTSKKKTAARNSTGNKGFTKEERAAMRERAKELKEEARKADGEKTLLAAIDKMQGSDRALAKKVHAIIKATAPDLTSKTWYGMPAYAKDDKVVCFFQDAGKFGSRYATLGFTDVASLDKGDMWPTTYALKKLTGAEETKIKALVKKAVS